MQQHTRADAFFTRTRTTVIAGMIAVEAVGFYAQDGTKRRRRAKKETPVVGEEKGSSIIYGTESENSSINNKVGVITLTAAHNRSNRKNTNAR